MSFFKNVEKAVRLVENSDQNTALINSENKKRFDHGKIVCDQEELFCASV